MAVEPHNAIELINQIQQVTAQVVSSLSDRNSKHLCYLHQEHVCFWPGNTRLALVPQWVELLFLFTGNLVCIPKHGVVFFCIFFLHPNARTLLPLLQKCTDTNALQSCSDRSPWTATSHYHMHFVFLQHTRNSIQLKDIITRCCIFTLYIANLRYPAFWNAPKILSLLTSPSMVKWCPLLVSG